MESAENSIEIPWWTWAFVGICVAIPVISLGGAIPGALGCGGAGACYGIARAGKGTPSGRAWHCFLVCAVCWGAFGGLVWMVRGEKPDYAANRARAEEIRESMREEGREMKERASTIQDEPKELTRHDKREIYAKLASFRAKITRMEGEINERRREGKSTKVHEEQLAHLESMYESKLEFAMRWNKISREELDAIIREGDALFWAYNE